MATRIFQACKVITSCVQKTSIINNGISPLSRQVLLIQNAKAHTNFFNKLPASRLWKSVTSVSNAGKRRGRGKGATKMRDLNRGQKIGWGKTPILFPGLNAPIVRGEFIIKQRRLTPTEQENMAPPAPPPIVRKRAKVHPLLRGYTGGFPAGRRIGPPDPVDGDAFEGFESWIVYTKNVSVMSSTMGRQKSVRCVVVTGNRKGLAGFVMISGRELRPTLTTAKNKAGQRLVYIERYNDHTVLHDFFTQFGKVKIFVQQKPKGYGLKCHRVIRSCCEAIGIQDIYAKVTGSKNPGNIVRAFFIGLLQQKTHEQMANEKQLHLVEMRKENNYFPTVLASPAKVRSPKEIPKDEHLDFNLYIMNGKVPLKKKQREPFYTKLPSWLIHLRKQERQRGQDDVLIRLRAEYGEICSFLTDQYPEARPQKGPFKQKTEEEN